MRPSTCSTKPSRITTPGCLACWSTRGSSRSGITRSIGKRIGATSERLGSPTRLLDRPGFGPTSRAVDLIGGGREFGPRVVEGQAAHEGGRLLLRHNLAGGDHPDADTAILAAAIAAPGPAVGR